MIEISCYKTIMLLDDHPMIGHALSTKLRDVPHFQVVGDFTTSRDLIRALDERSVDVIVMDYTLGPDDIDGLNLIRRLRARRPGCRILVMSSHYNPATVRMAMQVGADGFLGKSQRITDVIDAIYEVLRGGKYLHPDMRAQLPALELPPCACQRRAQDIELPDSGRHILNARLSVKEYEVVRCIVEGLSTSEIAEKFHRQASTISTQKKSAFHKLGVDSVPQLVSLFGGTRR